MEWNICCACWTIMMMMMMMVMVIESAAVTMPDAAPTLNSQYKSLNTAQNESFSSTTFLSSHQSHKRCFEHAVGASSQQCKQQATGMSHDRRVHRPLSVCLWLRCAVTAIQREQKQAKCTHAMFVFFTSQQSPSCGGATLSTDRGYCLSAA